MREKTIRLRNRNEARGRALDFTMGVALGVLVFLLLYGASTLNVTYDSWIYKGYIEKDIVQRYAGWLFYRAAPWNWPLTVASNLAVPLETAIVYTDSIPLVAILCKAFSAFLPATFQYFGWYNLLNFALQGGFAMLLLRHFKLGRVFCLPASLLFLLAPIFVERVFRHDALASQWMVLAAILCYLRSRRGGQFPALGFWVLCFLAPSLHTYFVPMVYALLLAALIEYAIYERRWLREALYLLGCMAGTVIMAYMLGLLTRGGGGLSGGYGGYSMNLNALWNPSSFDYLSDAGYLGWSCVLPRLAQNRQQYDGFQYMGLGLLLAWVAMVGYGLFWFIRVTVRQRYKPLRQVGAFLKSHIPLLAVLACLAVFAVSHVVVLNDVTLFTVPLPEQLAQYAGIFRASGRFFWPISYFLILAPLVCLGRVLPRRWPMVGLAALLAVQMWDLSGVLKQKHDYFAKGPLVQEDVYTLPEWQSAMEAYDTVFVLDDLFDYDLAAGLIRYNTSRVTNLPLANRGSFEVLRVRREEVQNQLLLGQPLEVGTLYLTRDVVLLDRLQKKLPEDTLFYTAGEYTLFAAPEPEVTTEAAAPSLPGALPSIAG